MNRLMKRPMVRGLLTLAFMASAGMAWAQQDSYINNAIVTYPGTGPNPPNIDATNFVNLSQFTVNFTQVTLDPTQPLFATWDTLNYTNLGTLTANTGFQFDTQSSASYLRTRAASFYNAGTINCASLNNDPSDPYGGLLAIYGYGQCIVNASNILNPGVVVAGVDGLIQFRGNNVDLSRSSLTIEASGLFGLFGRPGGVNVGGTAVAGLNTNAWDPSTELGSQLAISAPFPIAPGQLVLTNATVYIDTSLQIQGTNIIRAVYIQDHSGSNIVVNVYFGESLTPFGGNFGIDDGNVTIEWAGSYFDPATANTYSNYLYLHDDFLLGASTNVLPIAVPPANFSFNESATPEIFAPIFPAASGFIPVFFPGPVTNRYDFLNGELLASSPTNAIANGSVTNLPGRVEIFGDSFLNLSNAEIRGQSYTSLVSTNEFAGSGGAFIETPYADLNLGTTNGILYVTNTIEASVPVWGHSIQAWNTVWTLVDTTLQITNQYRVLLVGSQLTTTVAAQVQDLILRDYQSKHIIISDTFHIMRTFSADAESLTLTTNPPGTSFAPNGATSLDGELNLDTPNIFWQSSVPNLRYLTNNGAIRMQNLALFGNPLLTNVVPPVPASGTLSEISPNNVVKKDKVTIGTNQYLFVGTLTNSIANQVAIAPASFDASLSNLIAAINHAGGAGVAYSTATKTNSFVVAGPLTNHSFTVTAITNGPAGNSIATVFTPATGSVNLSWGGHGTLFGGAGMTTNTVPFQLGTAFINDGFFFDQGSIIYSGNFESSGVFSNGIGSFALQSLTTTLTNGSFYAGGDVSITASSLVTSNVFLLAGRSLTLQVTNLLTDSGPSPTNNNIWTIGYSSVGSGFNLPVKPAVGDLLGTMVTLAAPTNRNVVSVWAGQDRGISPAGYTNNAAIGLLTLDVGSSPTPGHNGVLTFNGAGVSNALYVDTLILTNFATHGNATNNFNFPWLSIGTNMVVYFAQALENGLSVAQQIDEQSKIGANAGRLRWVYSYAGYYSSTNFVYPDGTTNVVNTALAQSTLDSDGDGIPNVLDPTPFYVATNLNLTVSLTNLPPRSIKVQWTTIPNATNYVYYSTNLLSASWLPLTNFPNWYFGNNVARTNSAHSNHFTSPQAYINNASLPDNSQQTNVWIFDTITNVPHYYKVVIWPWLNFPE